MFAQIQSSMFRKPSVDEVAKIKLELRRQRRRFRKTIIGNAAAKNPVEHDGEEQQRGG